MTIEEYKDKYFKEYRNLRFFEDDSCPFCCYLLDKSGYVIALHMDGTIKIETNYKFSVSFEMMADLRKVVKSDSNIKRWKKINRHRKEIANLLLN